MISAETIRHLFLEPSDKLVKIKSWWPTRGPHGVEWPTMLIDTAYGQRQLISPVWDRARFALAFRNPEPTRPTT